MPDERMEAENDNGGDLTRCEFCGRPILGRIVMDVNFTPSCEECAGAAAIQGGRSGYCDNPARGY